MDESYEQPEQTRKEILKSLEVTDSVSSVRGNLAEPASGDVAQPRASLLGLGITPSFKKGEWVDIRGKQVRNIKDIVAIGRLFRNPQFEVFHVVYSRGGLLQQREGVRQVVCALRIHDGVHK